MGPKEKPPLHQLKEKPPQRQLKEKAKSPRRKHQRRNKLMGRFESNKSRNYFLVHNAPATTTNHIVNHHLFTHLDSKGTFGEGISIQDNIYLVGKGGSILD